LKSPRLYLAMRRNLLWSVAAILRIIYIAARILDHWGLRVPAQILEVVGADWIGLLSLLLAALLAVDLVTVFGRGTSTWGPRMRLWQRGEIIWITVRSDDAA